LEASASELKAAMYGLNWDKTLSSIDLEVRRWLLLFDLLLGPFHILRYLSVLYP